MRYKLGQSGNPEGRRRGVPNKLTLTLRGRMSDFLSNNYEGFLSDYAKLKPLDRCKVYSVVLQFVLPKLQAVSLETNEEPVGEIILTTVRNKLIDKLTQGKPKAKKPEEAIIIKN